MTANVRLDKNIAEADTYLCRLWMSLVFAGAAVFALRGPLKRAMGREIEKSGDL